LEGLKYFYSLRLKCHDIEDGPPPESSGQIAFQHLYSFNITITYNMICDLLAFGSPYNFLTASNEYSGKHGPTKKNIVAAALILPPELNQPASRDWLIDNNSKESEDIFNWLMQTYSEVMKKIHQSK
jgi:hypothetical protein